MSNPLISSGKNLYFAIAAILVIALGVYFPTLFNDFVNFDDHLFVTENPNIEGISLSNLVYNFTHQTGGHYQPIVQLSYMLDYSIAGRNPMMYHFTSLLFHLLNIILVFLLSSKLLKHRISALLVAIFFAVHPMNVESICWVSGRNGVVFPFFFLLSLIMYERYISGSKKKKYIYLTFVFFVMALISKSAAVSLPVVLLLFDFFFRRKLSKLLVLEKVPFFIASLAAGIIAILAAKDLGSMDIVRVDYSLVDRVFMVCYSFLFYIYKLFFPFNLIIMHFSPDKTAGFLPLIFYITPVMIALLIFGVYRSGRLRRKIIFAIGFYLVTILLFLQIIPIGGTIVSERYAYFPYFGLLLGIAFIIDDLIDKRNRLWKINKPILITIVPLFLALFIFLTFQRSRDWKNGETLFTNYIEHKPEIGYGYYGRGGYYLRNEELDKALIDFDKSIELSPIPEYFKARGVLKNILNDSEGAINDFNLAISLDSVNIPAYGARAYAKFVVQDYTGAIDDYEKMRSIKEGPVSPNVYYYAGVSNLFVGRFEEAIEELNVAITSEFDTLFHAYYNRGNAYKALSKYPDALQDYSKAIELKPDFADAYNNRGVIRYFNKNYKEAISDFSQAIYLKESFGDAFNNRGNAYFFTGDTNSACADWKNALLYGHLKVMNRLDKYCN